MQDVLGKVRESMYEGEWSKGTEKDVIATAKLHSPLACTSKELEQVSLFTEAIFNNTDSRELGRSESTTSPRTIS